MIDALRRSAFYQSICKNRVGMLLMFASALLTAFAQFIWKLAGSENYVLLGVGLVLYGVSSVLMIVAFRFGSLSVLHPVMSTNYGIGLLLSFLFLGEVITPVHILGVLVIMAGVTLIGGGDA